MKRFRTLFLVLSVLLLAACSDFENNAYNTLVIAGETYDATMSALADAHAGGTLDDAQYAKAKAVARIYRGAFQSARIALEEYVASPGDTQRDRVTQMLVAMTGRLSELLDCARGMGVGIHDLKTGQPAPVKEEGHV
jgi:hypothetical protein